MTVELVCMVVSIVGMLAAFVGMLVARHAEREAQRHARNAWSLAESTRGLVARLQRRDDRPN